MHWVLLCPAASAQTSQLWGRAGERWSPESRLPDFSFAGYRRGEEPFRIPRQSISVADFGARGDGRTDDTAAFRRALAAGAGKLILIPAGQYVLSDRLEVRHSDLVLRGEGPDKTVLRFVRPLEELYPRPVVNDGGKPTTGWSWGGGLIDIGGREPKARSLVAAAEPARRGQSTITLAEAAFDVGDELQLVVSDDRQKSLVNYLYRGQPGNISGLNDRTYAQVFRVLATEGKRLTLDRPLRFDLRPEWKPSVRPFTPAVTDVGVEQLGFAFPDKQYAGHFLEVGYNAMAVNRSAAHCWLRNIHIHNADSGPYVSGWFCTLDGVRLTADPQRLSDEGYCGHHGITLSGNDCLCTRFVIETRFIHDLTVQSSLGCVFSAGKAVDLNMDHHRWGPYENLFTDLDAGKGTRLFASSGGGMRGAHTAAGETFWNIRAARKGPWPKSLGIDRINLVAVAVEGPEVLDPDGRWLEQIPPGKVQPPDLHRAMLHRRLGGAGKSTPPR